ncbi:NaeI family type II restriction endonuclease [Streptomyces sp. NPDC006372]|uniref:NaeI family type II restriction endonuclease n=1 Tax=Streptomyces sp. NPDC006372 TaxID=3155599 RepID=UPI0033BAC6D0
MSCPVPDEPGASEGLSRVLTALRAAAPDLDGTALAEVLWLAARMAGDSAAVREQPTDPRPDRPAANPVRPAPTPDRSVPQPTAAAPVKSPDAGRSGAAAGADRPADHTLHERRTGERDLLRGTALPAPRAAALPQALELTRALRPWKRRWREGRRSELDVDMTVAGYARSGQLIPVFAPAPERWFDVTFVVDRSPGMRVWRETVEEFTALATRISAFRTLRVRDLTFRPDGTPVSPGRLGSSSGRMLVVLVSDCAAAPWRRPEVWQLVHAWAGATPTALLNPLPTRLWPGTGLDLPMVRTTPTVPGPYGTRLPYDVPPLLDMGSSDGLGPWQPVPVLSLSAHSVGRWSRALMRNDPAGCSAVLVPPTGRLPARSVPATRPVPPQMRAHGFLRTASRAAVRLAVLCSTFDRLSSAVLHLVREALVPEATTADVAEVVTSGLFQVTEDRDAVELTLTRAAQEVLREQLPQDDVWRLHEALDRHLRERIGGDPGLAAVLPDPAASQELPAELRPFARASRETLELLGVSVPERAADPRTVRLHPQPEPDSAPGPHELPPAPVPFVGSEQRVQDLAHLLVAAGDGSRRVCVTEHGARPGAGRTALALHIAHRVRDSFPDGQVFLDLRGSTPHPVDADAALYMLLTALGQPAESVPRTTDELVAAAVTALRGRRTLVVLDDAHATGFLDRLTAKAPFCAWLVTVRDPGRSPRGFTTVGLRSLPEGDVCEMLAAVSGARLSGSDRQRLRAAVDANGPWSPLAVELCAAWFTLDATRSVDDLIRLIGGARGQTWNGEDRFVFLGQLARVLPEHLREAAARLAAVGTGLLTLHEAGALLERDGHGARETLEPLVRAGVLERRGVDRYRFHSALHAALRPDPGRPGYGRDGRPSTDECLSDFYLAAASILHEASRPGSGLVRLLGVPEVSVTAQVASSLTGGLSSTWVANALTYVAEAGVQADQHTRNSLSELLFLLRDVGGSALHRRDFEQAAKALTAPVAKGLPPEIRLARLAVASAHHAGGRVDAAARELEPLILAADGVRDDLWTGHISSLSGALALDRGAFAPARRHYERACAAFEALPDPYALAEARLGLARAELNLGATSLALELAEAVAGVDFAPTRVRLARDARHLLVVAASAAGRHARALEVQTELCRVYEVMDEKPAMGEVLAEMADTCLQLDRSEEAVEALEAALTCFERPGLERERATTLAMYAAVLTGMGEPERALEALDEAVSLMEGRDNATVARLKAMKRAYGVKTVIGLELTGEIEDEEEDARLSDALLLAALEAVRSSRVVPNMNLVSGETISHGCLLIADGSIETAALVHGLAQQLPRTLTVSGFPYTVHMAVDIAPGAPPVRHRARLLLHDHAIRSLARSSATWPTAHMSAEAHAAMTAGVRGKQFFIENTSVQAASGARLLVPAEPVWPLNDPDLRRVTLACKSADPEGRRMGMLLRESIDAMLDTETTGRFDPARLSPKERSGVITSIEQALRRWPSFLAGDSTDLLLPAAGDEVDAVGFDVKFSLSGRWSFAADHPGRIIVLIQADDHRSRWSMGVLRLEPLHLNAGATTDGRRTLRSDALTSAVLWLHMQEPLPENLLLHLPAEDREAVFSGPRVRRMVRLFVRVQERPVAPSALRQIGGTHWQRRLREAVPELREQGILLLGPRAADRSLARELGTADGSRSDGYVSVRLTRYQPDRHRNQQYIELNGTRWVRAAVDDPVEPLPELRRQLR